MVTIWLDYLVSDGLDLCSQKDHQAGDCVHFGSSMSLIHIQIFISNCKKKKKALLQQRFGYIVRCYAATQYVPIKYDLQPKFWLFMTYLTTHYNVFMHLQGN